MGLCSWWMVWLLVVDISTGYEAGCGTLEQGFCSWSGGFGGVNHEKRIISSDLAGKFWLISGVL